MESLPVHRKISIASGTIVKTILILVLFWLAFYLRDIVFVVIASVVIASSIEPIVRWLMMRHIPRTVAVLFIYASVAITFVGTFYFLLVPLFGELQSVSGSLPDFVGSLATSPTAKNVSWFDSSVTGIINNLPVSEIVARFNDVVTALSQNAFATASVILGGILNFLLIVVLSFYLAVQSGGITNFLKIISPAAHRKYVVNLWGRAEEKIGLWLQGQLLLGVIIAVLAYLGLVLLGVKHALLLAVVAGVFEIIPLFGPILAAIPGILFAYSTGGFTSAFFVACFYLIIQQFESQLIYPLVVKKVIGVPPIISIIALVVGAKLAGFLGLLLSVPVATILMEFFNDLERDRFAEDEKSKKST